MHVAGAAEQVDDLISQVGSYRLAKLDASLLDKLVTVQKLLTSSKPTQACENLSTFLQQVRAQAGKGLTPAQALALTTDAQRIRTVIS